ncbi:MAG: hypothetical protein JXR10_06975 [Cyclobacteriaceae bacterium]
MTLDQFLRDHDKPGAIVLLEGKRDVSPEDINQLVALGKLLCLRTEHIVFRSGNAAGSDEYFSKGVVAVDANRLEVITPYSGHRKKQNQAGYTYSLDEMNIVEDSPVVTYSKGNKKVANLVDRYMTGDRGRFAIKAAYLLRDTAKVTGVGDVFPATFGIFYDDLKKPKSGGTGHTMLVCDQLDVPYCTQEVWIQWL